MSRLQHTARDARNRRWWRRATAQAATAPAPAASPILTPPATVGLTLWFGLVCGLLTLTGERFRWAMLGHESWLGFNQMHQQYLWTVPASTLLIFAPVAAALGLLAWWRPCGSFRRMAAVFISLGAITLLAVARALHPLASIVLATGAAALAARRLERHARHVLALARRSLAPLLAVAAGLAAISLLGQSVREHQAVRALPPSAPDAPNVLLIVLDAVRADALSADRAQRNTTPFLAQLARDGVRFENARATAPWTLPSHASLFTGRFPNEFQVGVKQSLDGSLPTLAEYLAARGYVTGGFAANYVYCTWNYGLQRGFIHYEDRPISIDDVLGSSPLGRQLFPYFDATREAVRRWTRLGMRPSLADPRVATSRRSAAEINRSFLHWLKRYNGNGRPFFAFLNYFDAHAPWIMPTDRYRPFGLRPETPADYYVLRNWDRRHTAGHDDDANSSTITPRDSTLARDGYADCIAFIDRQLRRLFTELQREGVLDNTLVIVTADHGEEFGEHGLLGHFVSVHRRELDVPLLVFYPRRVPRGVSVPTPVSLRNVPATVVELAGAQRGSPFPGRSLACYWDGRSAALDRQDDPVYSELTEYALQALRADTKVYIHHRSGFEQLFDLASDPGEDRNLAPLPQLDADLRRFRAILDRVDGRPPADRTGPAVADDSRRGADRSRK